MQTSFNFVQLDCRNHRQLLGVCVVGHLTGMSIVGSTLNCATSLDHIGIVFQGRSILEVPRPASIVAVVVEILDLREKMRPLVFFVATWLQIWRPSTYGAPDVPSVRQLSLNAVVVAEVLGAKLTNDQGLAQTVVPGLPPSPRLGKLPVTVPRIRVELVEVHGALLPATSSYQTFVLRREAVNSTVTLRQHAIPWMILHTL